MPGNPQVNDKAIQRLLAETGPKGALLWLFHEEASFVLVGVTEIPRPQARRTESISLWRTASIANREFFLFAIRHSLLGIGLYPGAFGGGGVARPRAWSDLQGRGDPPVPRTGLGGKSAPGGREMEPLLRLVHVAQAEDPGGRPVLPPVGEQGFGVFLTVGLRGCPNSYMRVSWLTLRLPNGGDFRSIAGVMWRSSTGWNVRR